MIKKFMTICMCFFLIFNFSSFQVYASTGNEVSTKYVGDELITKLVAKGWREEKEFNCVLYNKFGEYGYGGDYYGNLYSLKGKNGLDMRLFIYRTGDNKFESDLEYLLKEIFPSSLEEIYNKIRTTLKLQEIKLDGRNVVIDKRSDHYIQINIGPRINSNALKNSVAKINHLTYSLKNNYLGLKNQATWELYIKQARDIMRNIPSYESKEKNDLNQEVNRDAALVQGLARINHVEKSMAPKSEGGYGNSLTMKNVPQWQEYIRLAEIDLGKIDKNVFKEQFNELQKRKNIVLDKIQTIIDASNIN